MFRRRALDPVCALCRLGLDPNKTAIRAPTQKPWLATRAASTRRQQPSRMVLSDRVGQRSSTRRDENRDKKPRKRAVDGPFMGMNRTVANIDPIRRIAQSRTRATDTNESPDDKSEKGEKAGSGRNKASFKTLRMHRALAGVSYEARMAVKEKMRDIVDFDRFDLLPTIKDAVLNDLFKDRTEIKPTPIQRLAIPAILDQTLGAYKRPRGGAQGRREFLLAAETGSGKTLGYLLPALHAMKVAEEADEELKAFHARAAQEKLLRADSKFKGKSAMEPSPYTARPRVIILVPTAELVDQVGAVLKKLSHMVKYRSEALSANFDSKIIERRIYNPNGVDVIVSTPHLLASIAGADPNILSRVTHLIIDEADSLLDRSFSPTTISIMDPCMPSLQSLIFCSATIPRRLDHYLEERFPNMKRITTPNLHAIPRHVQLGVIDASREPYSNNKSLACADAIWSIGRDAAVHEGTVPGEIDVKRILIFVNEREKTQEVADYLVSKGIDAVALHRDTPENRQSEMLAMFTTAEPMRKQVEDIDRTSLAKGKRALENTKVIVATDLASRGIDTLGVRFVVLYDVPHTTIDFIHRLGRAGRMGRRGRGIVIMGKDDRRDIVAEVKESMFMGQALV